MGDIESAGSTTEHAPSSDYPSRQQEIHRDLEGNIKFTLNLHVYVWSMCVCVCLCPLSLSLFDMCHTTAKGSGVKVDCVHCEGEPQRGPDLQHTAIDQVQAVSG